MKIYILGLQEITHRQLAYIWFNTPINVDKVDQFLNQLLSDGIPDKLLKEGEDLNETTQMNEKAILTLNHYKDLHINILKVLTKFKLPQVNGFKFINVPKQCTNLKELMLNSISHKSSCFYFSHPSSESCSDYIFGLSEAISTCSKYISLSYVRFTQPEFCSFMKAARGAKLVELRFCTIHSFSNCDFGKMKGCKIEILRMHQSGTDFNSYWDDNKENLFNVIAGINNCENMRNSITEISLFDHYYDGEIKIEKELRQKFKSISHIQLSLVK